MTTFTPRRSARGQIFTPSPHPETALQPKNVIFGWTSAPLPPSASSPASLDPEGKRTYYNSFTRITTKHRREDPLATPGKRPKAAKGDEESRFTIGDGVLVKVQGNADGVGVLVRLWEEPEEQDDSDDDQSEEATREDGLEQSEKGDGVGMRMMAEIHWCFRRGDLPGIMKNLTVEDVRALTSPSPYKKLLKPSSCGSCLCWRDTRTQLTPERGTPGHFAHSTHHNLPPAFPPRENCTDLLPAILQIAVRTDKVGGERLAVCPNGDLLVCAGL